MANRKLFNLTLATPTNSKKIAFGDSGTTANNITLGDFKTWLGLTENTIKTATFEIGAWNMDSSVISPPITIYSAISYGYKYRIPMVNIRSINVIIRNDAGTSYTDFLSVQNGTVHTVPQIQISEIAQFIGPSPMTFVYLQRRASSYFDTADYNDAVINRGWVTVNYVK